jgi:uncharacterized protein (DUF58 family)
MEVGVGLTIGILALLVSVAGWRLGATSRGLTFLAVAAALGIGGRIAGVEEFVLLAVALGVLLAVGPIVLWHRAERSTGTVAIELLPSSHEVSVGADAFVTLIVRNIGSRTSAPMRLEGSRDVWRVTRPGFRSRAASTTDRRAISPDSEASTQARGGQRRERGWRGRVARAVKVPALGPGERAQIDVEVPTDRRGVLTLAGLRLWCLDAFELFAYELAVSAEASIVVVPAATPPIEVVRGVLQPASRLHWSPPPSGEATGGPGFDLSGLRPYVPGDRLRLLHWPTLARTGELVVRDFEGSGSDAVTVVMDDRAGVISERDFESIVRATAGIGEEATRAGLGMDLRTPGGVSVDMQAGPLLRKAMLRLLATVDLMASRSNAAQVGTLGLRRSEDGSDLMAEKLRIVVTSAEGAGSLPDLLKRSSTVVVV